MIQVGLQCTDPAIASSGTGSVRDPFLSITLVAVTVVGPEHACFTGFDQTAKESRARSGTMRRVQPPHGRFFTEKFGSRWTNSAIFRIIARLRNTVLHVGSQPTANSVETSRVRSPKMRRLLPLLLSYQEMLYAPGISLDSRVEAPRYYSTVPYF